MSGPFRIAIAGLGTVGAGTLQMLESQADVLVRRCSRRLEVTAVSARDRSKERGVDISGFRWFDDRSGYFNGGSRTIICRPRLELFTRTRFSELFA